MMYMEDDLYEQPDPDEFGERLSDLDEEDYFSRSEFADPGGNSALRAASPSNPRNLPCPTCGWPNRLTPKDVALHYQCDSCADAYERGGEIYYYEPDTEADL
jgi:hypothetical protein